MRALLSLLVTLLAVVVSGCPLAPPRTSGEGAGAVCHNDLECASGLACECGVCAEPSGEPPRCIDLNDACSEVPSECFQACGDLTVVGDAACVDGRETCSAVGGVLRSQCPADTCWGDPAPGEVCVDGQFQCEVQPRSSSGDCYTFDCESGAAGQCVPACGDGSSPVAQACVASEWRCESGVPVEECGACVGPLPSCVISCDEPTAVGGASCSAALEWSCEHILLNGVPATVDSECCANDPAACAGDAGPDAGGDLDAGGLPDDGGGSDAGPSADAGRVDAGADVDGGANLGDGGEHDASVGDAG